jgi:hypothetical protein
MSRNTSIEKKPLDLLSTYLDSQIPKSKVLQCKERKFTIKRSPKVFTAYKERSCNSNVQGRLTGDFNFHMLNTGEIDKRSRPARSPASIAESPRKGDMAQCKSSLGAE